MLDGADELLHVGFAGDVGLYGECALPESGDLVYQRFGFIVGAQVVDCDVATCSGKHKGGGAAYAARSAGDERCPAVNFHLLSVGYGPTPFCFW